MDRIRGRVVWFSESKGFGFIKRASGPDLFLHSSALRMHVPGSLREGAEVEFDVSGPDGRHADSVALVDATASQ